MVDIQFLNQIGGSALTDSSINVPMGGVTSEIPVTYVPARNMIFLALATAYAEVIRAEAIYIGVSAVDFSGYPDCRPEFIESMTNTINLATKQGVTGEGITIKTPLIFLSKKETIAEGLRLKVPYHLTTSCYNGAEKACGKCESCLLRIKGFREVHSVDPIEYEINIDW